MKIKIYTTGGSIDKAYSTQESAFLVGEPQIGSILREANASLEYDVESLLKKDSLEITSRDRQTIVDRIQADSRRRIITHGTDTMIETARALHHIAGKVIVLTGAMQPATFKQTDATFVQPHAFLSFSPKPVIMSSVGHRIGQQAGREQPAPSSSRRSLPTQDG